MTCTDCKFAAAVIDKSILRAAILDVIDEGDPEKVNPAWAFYLAVEELANDERLRFCDAVLARYEKLVRDAAIERAERHNEAGGRDVPHVHSFFGTPMDNAIGRTRMCACGEAES